MLNSQHVTIISDGDGIKKLFVDEDAWEQLFTSALDDIRTPFFDKVIEATAAKTQSQKDAIGNKLKKLRCATDSRMGTTLRFSPHNISVT